jgi:endoglucanase
MLAVSAAPLEDTTTDTPLLPRMKLGRRSMFAISTAALVALPACGWDTPRQAAVTAPDDPLGQWRDFRDRFITAEGRVVDTGNQGISHSEGQGYGMLFAEAHDDRPTFERLYNWARRMLRRPDGLYAWRFRPNARNPVEDPNNATDGDLYLAWALLRAADRWNEPEWRREGQAIGQAILRRLVVEVGGRTVLLPGADGFAHPDRVVVNPSYYAFPAMFALARAVPDRAWQRVMGDGVAMMRGMRYGRWGLPADWVELTRGQGSVMRPAAGWPARFSFDAVRVPLHLAWAGMQEETALRSAVNFWNDPGLAVRPAWTDLRSGQISPYTASPGMMAVADVATAVGWQRIIANPLPSVAASGDYYSAALAMLARLALRENPRNLMADAAPTQVRRG